MEATATQNQPEAIYSVDYKDCINFSGERFSEKASINFGDIEPKTGNLCIYRIEGMNKLGLAHLSEKTESGVIFEFTDGTEKRKSGLTPISKVRNLHRVESISVDYL